MATGGLSTTACCVFEVAKPAIENTPQDWEDLLKPEYKGKVAMAGDVLKSNQSVMTVYACRPVSRRWRQSAKAGRSWACSSGRK